MFLQSSVIWDHGILVKEPFRPRPTVDQLKCRGSAYEANEVAESDKTSIIALGHSPALILTEEILRRHIKELYG